MERQGNLSINSDNIFPIIKKWLYSDQDIFIRELISNGCDAITKLKKLAVMGEYEEVEGEEYKIELVYADNASDSTKAPSAAQLLISKNVSVVLGTYG